MKTKVNSYCQFSFANGKEYAVLADSVEDALRLVREHLGSKYVIESIECRAGLIILAEEE